MIRRRRPKREIAFSFDSFLDVVANVVGIIIRLILVAWVGARSYSTLNLIPKQAAPTVEVRAEFTDPLQDELAAHRRELDKAQALLLERLRELNAGQEELKAAQGAMATLVSRTKELENQRAGLVQPAPSREHIAQMTLTLAELRERCRKVTEELHALEKLPPAKHALRFRTPVSQEVHSEELMFECHDNRVIFIQTEALLEEVRRGMSDKREALRSQWAIQETAGPAGGFLLRYTVERERDVMDGAMAIPNPNASFRYGVSEWHLEPIDAIRGETADAALTKGSQFRQVVDPLDAQITAVTFWVYPDSFDTYRRLRDYLYEHDIMVAGRPLPEGFPITSSRRGSVSRGQ